MAPLRYFDADLTPPGRAAPPRPDAAQVRETVTVTRAPSSARGYLARDPRGWDWSDLRDYVVHEHERRFGTFPRDSRKEHGIFTRFLREYGEDAARIARYAFDECDGVWHGAPVRVERFARGSDPYFSQVILDRLRAS